MSFKPPISPKQAAILNAIKLFLLVTGPRKASKTIGCEHACAWHLWSTPRAVGMMLGNTISQNSDSGPWAHLTSNVIPTWVNGDFGMELVTPVRMEATTHKLYFEVTNRFYDEFGPELGVSRMYLDSLDIEDNAEDKFKGKFFSLIYWTELSNFKKRKTFDVLQECLRCDWLKPEQHRLIADTNPADEGEDSWIWQLWYWFRTLDLDDLNEETKEELNLAGLEAEEYAETILAMKELQEQLEVHEFTIDDNIFLTPKQKRAQKAKYIHDKDLLDRYYYGRWVRASGDGIFSEVWRPEIQLIGDPPRGSDDGGPAEMMLPEPDCIELGGGADLSSRRNAAFVLTEPVIVEVEEFGKLVPKVGIKVLDEYVSIGKQQKIWEIAEAYEEKVMFWNAQCAKPPQWLHASDSSSFDVSGQTATSEASDIYRLTEGLVELKSILRIPHIKIKGHGGVEKGIELIQRMLFENRIWVNKAKCPQLAEMFSTIKRNKHGKLSSTNPYKHVMDALRYYASWKCWQEIKKTARVTTTEKPRIIYTSI